jgi:hypothetical protein
MQQILCRWDPMVRRSPTARLVGKTFNTSNFPKEAFNSCGRGVCNPEIDGPFEVPQEVFGSVHVCCRGVRVVSRELVTKAMSGRV